MIIHPLTCNTTFHKTYHLYKFKSFLSFKIHYMFWPTWASSGVKNTSSEEITHVTDTHMHQRDRICMSNE
jgi:hypothetical protein